MLPSVSPGVKTDTITPEKCGSSHQETGSMNMSVQEISKVHAQASSGIAGKYFFLYAKRKATVLVVFNGPSNGSTARFVFADENFGTIVDLVSGTGWQPGADSSEEATNIFNAVQSLLAFHGWSAELFSEASAIRFSYLNFDHNVPSVTDPANTAYINDAAVLFHGGPHRFYIWFNDVTISTIDPNNSGALDEVGEPTAISVPVDCGSLDVGDDGSPEALAEIIKNVFNTNTIEFTATRSGSVVTVTHVEAGAIRDIEDGDTGWTLSVDTQGA